MENIPTNTDDTLDAVVAKSSTIFKAFLSVLWRTTLYTYLFVQFFLVFFLRSYGDLLSPMQKLLYVPIIIPHSLSAFPVIILIFLFFSLWQLNRLIYTQGKDLVQFNVPFLSLVLFIIPIGILFFITNDIAINNFNDLMSILWLELAVVGISILILFMYMMESKNPNFRFNFKKIGDKS